MVPAELPEENITEGARLQTFDPDELETAPTLFQYKGQTDAEGVSEKLRDVKTWDPDLANISFVWERIDGQKIIVDGHQRLGLAKRLKGEGQQPRMLAQVWREADGIQPRELMLKAAKKNIGEGSGTATDAARVLQEDPALFDTLSQGNAIVRDARGLSRLAPDVQTEVFEFVNNDRLPCQRSFPDSHGRVRLGKPAHGA